MGTGALHVAIGQEALTTGAIWLGHSILINMALFEEGEEDVMTDLSMVRCTGAGEDVERDAQLLPGIEEKLVIALRYFPGCLSFLLGTKGDRPYFSPVLRGNTKPTLGGPLRKGFKRASSPEGFSGYRKN